MMACGCQEPWGWFGTMSIRSQIAWIAAIGQPWNQTEAVVIGCAVNQTPVPNEIH